jgi:hypothetical protein
MKNNENGWFVTFIVGVVALLIFYPILVFWFGYFGGWILSNFVGEHITQGVNLLLGRHSLEVDTIPILCGTLAVVGNYFKSTQTNNNK